MPVGHTLSPSFRLTVEEHVWFYGCLKGLSEAEVQSEMDTLLDDVGLLHKRHEQTKNLSGNFACLTFLLKKGSCYCFSCSCLKFAE